MDTYKKILLFILGVVLVLAFFSMFFYVILFLAICVLIYTLYRLFKDNIQTFKKNKNTKTKKKVGPVIIEAKESDYREK